jgi:SAM-dependent methyltransferase
VESTGIDFAPEMIEACESKRRDHGTENANFLCRGVFDFEPESPGFDLISALGLIEYLSPEELDALLQRARVMLRPGGAFVVGSRNRLYNLFSLNQYTLLDRQLGVIDALLREAIAIASAPTADQAIESASTEARRLPQPDSHPGTGIGVSVRYQYTPWELCVRLQEYGLRAVTIYPIHYHGLPAPAKERLMDVHIQMSNLAYEAAPEDHQLVPYCSSFVIEARA